MKHLLDRKYRLILTIVLVGSALIPIIITAYEILTTDKDSVVFLEGYNPIVSSLIIAYYIFLIGLGVLWIIKQLKSYVLLKGEIRKTELMHLKSQVNPHFFFNMLNNLYGLVDKDSKQAQELILKLSDMMRYSIYEGQKDTVLLSEEIDYLKNYIELHKMRYHKTIDIQFNVDIDDNDYQIMPLLFIILLENAFKHGVENLRENAYVYITMSAKHEQVHFDIKNNFDATLENEHEGIGLENLKRRLELVYPKHHDLLISKTNNIFNAQLTISKL
ncbi:sensor histidine kinase [Psychroserpens luteolus]|uniref:sensor histidine kinase n=1 Tax=Psychroserpens luteolus TaxID=2855840 RepID=UPI001E2ED59A|nr:histidine kinase [Psychroserpens luteolus]MCD2258797.1 histidine kinase [Psychroserpens luteolus]